MRTEYQTGQKPSKTTAAPSALRKDLRQQASRFALMSAIGVAAATGGSMMTPGTALADCVATPTTVVCNTTTTTNTTNPNGQPNDRAYALITAGPVSATVTAGSAVTGQGLAFSNTGDGGVRVVNNGTISVDAGNVPTAGGTAALTITSNGGLLSYIGGAITNNGTGNGLDARQNGGNDAIEITLIGAVRGASGVTARGNGSGSISIIAGGPVVGTSVDGISAQTQGGAISIAAGNATGQTGSGIIAQILNDPASTNAITITADNLFGRTGVIASNSGLGGVSLTTTGDVTGSIGEGVFVASAADVDVSMGGDVNGGTRGLVVQAAGDISVQATEINALNGNAVDIDNQGAGDVNFEATGAITAINGHGVIVRDTAIGGDISVTTGAVTALSAGYDGINVASSLQTANVTVIANDDIEADDIGVLAYISNTASTGDVSVTARGSVTAELGIQALTEGSGTVTVNAVGPINAIDYGIDAESQGGDITITTGAVTSTDNTAVLAWQQDAAGTGDIDITATGAVSGYLHGISARNDGTGAIRIVADGAVTGATQAGIAAQGNDAVSVEVDGLVTGEVNGLTVAGGLGGAGDISVTGAGGFTGVVGNAVNIENGGSGTVTFDVSGPITAATDGSGIVVTDTADGGDIHVTTGAVDAGEFGISVVSTSTTADVTIIAEGPVSASAIGISAGLDGATATGDINVTAHGPVTATYGIIAENNGAGSATVTATGPITSTNIGISASASSGDVTVNAGDVTSSSGVGILAVVDGAGAGDVTVAAGNVSGYRGINAISNGAGSVSVVASGRVNGTVDEGIVAGGNAGVSVSVADTVTGATSGLFLAGGAGGTGDISVTGNGGFIGQADDAALINNLGSGTVTVNIAGASGSAFGSGIVVRDTTDGGDISVTTGVVRAMTATEHAIDVRSASNTADITVVANGALGAGATGVQAALLDDATGNISVTTRGAIDAQVGINAVNLGTGSTTVTAVGPITATGYGLVARSSGGDVTVAAGDVTSGGVVGIMAMVEDGGAGDVSVTARNVSGGVGIYATSDGAGAISVFANGTVTGTAGEGIVVIGNGAASVVAANTVTGATRGLDLSAGAGGDGDISVTGAGGFTSQTGAAALINNLGSGTVTVDIAGLTRSTLSSGFVVRDTVNGGDISVTTGAVTATAANQNAIDIRSQSETADVIVVANGALTAGANGVLAFLDDADATGDINVRTNGAVTAALGINARNLGSGDVTVVATGAVTGGPAGVSAYALSGAVNVTASQVDGQALGITARAGPDSSSDVSVTAGSVSGSTAIDARHDGTGAVLVTTTGLVTADEDAGISARSSGGDITVNAQTVAGTAAIGIVAVQANAAGSGDITVNAVNASGDDGILAFNVGTGETRITTTGTVASSATGVYGIQAFTGAASGDITIDANNVSGANAGIRVDNNGVGDTDITVRGVVQGGSVGVSVYSDGDQDVGIANAGVIRSTAGLSSDRAIEAAGGFIDFINTGSLIGDINFQGDSSVFDNRGSWNTVGGDSSFAGVDDELINAATGSILAMSTAGVQDVTIFRGLETFRNDGRLTMGDNGAGDTVMTSANTVFGAGSLLQVDIAGQNLADLFATTGTLTLQAGAGLDVNFVQPLALSGRYVVARADGGLTGTFDFEDRLLSAFVGLRDGYTATTAYIEIGQLRALMDAGVTPNQRQTGAGADSLPATNPLKAALLVLPNDAAAQDAFDQLSGEIHPAARRAMADDSRQFRDAVLDRLSDERGNSTVWSRVLIEERVTDADDNAAKVEHDARGLLFGADRALNDTLTVGVAGGWFNTDLDIVRRDSSGSTQSRQVMAYLGARMDHWGLRAGVGYARTSTDTQREVAFTGFTASPTADYDGSVLQGFVEAGYRLPLHGGYVEPFVNLTTITAETDAFHEVEGPAALAVEAMSENLTATTLGFRFQTDRTGALSLRGTAGWRNLSGDLEPTGRHAFDGGTTFTVLGAAQSDTAAVANLEAQWRLSPNITVTTGYDGVFGNKGGDHGISGRFKMAF